MATMSSSNGRPIRWTSAACLVLAALAAGCAPMTASECRTANWQALGERDGLSGARPQIEQYAHQCQASNVTVAAGAYMEGWLHGKWEYDGRVHRSDCCGP